MGRDFFRYRTPLTVSEAAFSALKSILHTSNFATNISPYQKEDLTQAEREQLATIVRTFWLAHRGQSPQEQEYSILADDAASHDAWLEAARQIAQPANETYLPGGWTEILPLKPGETEPLQGASLRAKVNPSVSDLLVKRIGQIADTPDNSQTMWAIQWMKDATDMALILSRWDPGASAPVLRGQLARTVKLQETLTEQDLSQTLVSTYPKLTEARIAVNDPNAYGDYAKAVESIRAIDLPWPDAPAVFEPLWQHADNPDMITASNSLFNTPTAPLYHIADNRQSFDLIGSLLLAVPAFRAALQRELADTTCIQTITVTAPGVLTYRIQNGVPPSVNSKSDLPVGSVILVRRCDIIASALQAAEGTQAFDFTWSLADRNRAIESDKDVLSRYGSAYSYNAGMETVRKDPFSPVAHMSFTPLSRPATEDDVREGRAIFYAGKNAQIVPFKSLPVKAKLVQSIKVGSNASPYATEGWIWQAEMDDNGNIFYGFVAKGVMAKEPSSNVIVESEP